MERGVGIKKGKKQEEPKMFGAPVMSTGGRVGSKFKSAFGEPPKSVKN